MSPQFISEEQFKEMETRVMSSTVRRATAGPKHAVAMGALQPRDTRISGINSASSPYKSKWELNYAKVLDMELKVGAIKGWRYGGITFTLSKGQYHKIDFLIWHTNGQIELAQVKGYHKNLRAGIKGLKWAAQLHPWFTWTIKRWTGNGWDGDYVEI